MKSHTKYYLEVVQAVYEDACTLCVAEISMRDLQTIRSRVRSQGVSFLTLTLPNFCSDFEKSLELGFVDPSFFRSFRKNGAIPAFLRGMLGRIFNKETGRILDDGFTNPHSNHATLVGGVRQICNAFKKIELACSPARENRAMEGFVQNEESLEMFSLSESDAAEFSSVSDVLWAGFWGDFDLSKLVPRHGPGQTVERITGNQKYNWQRWHDRLEPYFPLLDSAFSASSGGVECQDEALKVVAVVPPDQEMPVRVTPVPKTLKGPRIIAIEPACMQYAQQAIRDYLYEKLQRHHWCARGHINFDDQTINQNLAVRSSSDLRLATIDLSDASDRVPWSVAKGMFDGNPDLLDAIDACRSTSAVMPDGTLVPLRKFASMGSALCFPVEAMYFYTACVVALLRERNLSVTPRNVFLVSCAIYVYGDDILVPTHHANAVLETLARYNCKVNTNKTFINGSFRESCGFDAYGGKKVTPIYIRRQMPQNRQQASEIVSWVASANQFLKRDYQRTSSLLFSKVEKLMGPLPSVRETSPVLGRHSTWTEDKLPRRFNSATQQMEIRCWVPGPVRRTDVLEGYGALQKCLTRLTRLPELKEREASALLRPFNLEQYLKLVAETDERHLERSALYGKVTLKRRWVPATTIAGLR